MTVNINAIKYVLSEFKFVDPLNKVKIGICLNRRFYGKVL